MVANSSSRQLPAGEPSLRQQSPASGAAGRSTLLDISSRLQPRDHVIADLLDRHGVLTTDQIALMLFHSVITCRHRLHALRRLGFVDRFVRNRPGQPRPMCWVPGLLSARYTALARGDPAPTARTLRERQDRIFASPRLDHLIGTNEVFVRLLASPDGRLVRWLSERDTEAAYGRRIHPDGHGVWNADGRSVGFFLEYDTGTESLPRLVGKLAAYRRLRVEVGAAYPVLFVLPSRVREQNLHRRIADGLSPGVVVATTTPEAGTDPAGPVWRLAGNGRHRLHLTDLDSWHGAAGPFNPGPPSREDDPLGLLHHP